MQSVQNLGLPSAVARVKGAVVTLVPMVACLTVGMFGVANSTCDDSSRVDCDRRAAVGKMCFQARRTQNTLDYEKVGSNSPEITYATPVARYLVGNGRHCAAASPSRWRRAGAGRRAAGGSVAPPVIGGVAELVFAAVRPGFIAACMVDAAGKRIR